jgi:hypothetical protein
LVALLAEEYDDVLEDVLAVQVLLALGDAVLRLAQFFIQLRHIIHKFLIVLSDLVDEPVLHLDQPLLKLFYEDCSVLHQLLSNLLLFVTLRHLYFS